MREATFDLLRLTFADGLGPVLIDRLLEAFGSAAEVLRADAGRLRAVRGIGPEKAAALARQWPQTLERAQRERDLAHRLGVQLLARDDPDYPALLAPLPAAPPLLYVRGTLRPHADDRYPVALVGSRRCTAYGLEQAARFAQGLADAGLTVISGGARGIDTAAHRGALRAPQGRTIAILGCGLSHAYPAENAELFTQIADGRGAMVSELPLDTPPAPENFPARNRLISGMSLGVLVIEAAAGSGALITARLAAEEHGRDVFVVPGRVDSPASEGSLSLIRRGGAALVTGPADVIADLESSARHAFIGTHAERFALQNADEPDPDPPNDAPQLAATTEGPAPAAHAASGVRSAGLSPSQRRLLEALDEPRSVDDLAAALTCEPAALRADITMLELRRLIVRRGAKLERT